LSATRISRDTLANVFWLCVNAFRYRIIVKEWIAFKEQYHTLLSQKRAPGRLLWLNNLVLFVVTSHMHNYFMRIK